MAKRSKKKAQQRGDTTVHYVLSLRDVKAWGRSTMCGKSASGGSQDHTKVTCTECMRHTNWNEDQYKASCSQPLVLCCLKDNCNCGPNPAPRWRME